MGVCISSKKFNNIGLKTIKIDQISELPIKYLNKDISAEIEKKFIKKTNKIKHLEQQKINIDEICNRFHVVKHKLFSQQIIFYVLIKKFYKIKYKIIISEKYILEFKDQISQCSLINQYNLIHEDLINVCQLYNNYNEIKKNIYKKIVKLNFALNHIKLMYFNLLEKDLL
jgi:hypothetical protein